MNGKEFLDEKFGEKRNGKGIASLLDEFAELKIEEYKNSSLKGKESIKGIYDVRSLKRRRRNVNAEFAEKSMVGNIFDHLDEIYGPKISKN